MDYAERLPLWLLLLRILKSVDRVRLAEIVEHDNLQFRLDRSRIRSVFFSLLLMFEHKNFSESSKLEG